jgi:hypothetical protein
VYSHSPRPATPGAFFCAFAACPSRRLRQDPGDLFSRCGLILTRVRFNGLLRTGEPYEPRSPDTVLTGIFLPGDLSAGRCCGAAKPHPASKKGRNDGSPNEEFGVAPARARPVMSSIIGAGRPCVITVSRKNPLQNLSRLSVTIKSRGCRERSVHRLTWRFHPHHSCLAHLHARSPRHRGTRHPQEPLYRPCHSGCRT